MADLGKVMLTPGGNYNPGTRYERLTLVEHEGSSYVSLKDLIGVTPTDDRVNWQLHGKGYPGNATGITVQDTQGLVVAAGQNTNEQLLINEISKIVATELLSKSDLVNQIINDATKVASAASLYAVNEKVTKVNSDFTNFKGVIQSGTVSVSAAANGTTEFTVNFPETFAKTPVVVMSVVTSRPDLRSAEPLSRDTKKVTGVVYNGTSASDLSVFWIAIAK